MSSAALVPEKFLLHTDGTEEFGGYSGGPAVLVGTCLYIRVRLSTNISGVP